MDKLKLLGLFSGIGGFEYGLQNAGMEIEAMCENDKKCNLVLDKHFKNINRFYDVKDINKTSGEYDIICGGFPCQDISIAGKNNGGLYGEKSGLWFEYLRIIDEIRPKYAVVENVYALRTRGLETLLQNLSEIGYDATWTTFDSQYFGNAQRRRRIYILAVRDGIPPQADIFRNIERSTNECKQKIQFIDQNRRWNFKEKFGNWCETSYFTRQSFEQFQELGVSSTLLKRDYKSFTDIVLLKNDKEELLRRVTPEERLLLQGFPVDWYDGLDLTDTDKFTMCGMCTNTVKYIGDCIINFDNSLK